MFVIFGANGKIGGATASALRRNGASVRAVVRDLKAASKLTQIGCEVVKANLYDEAQISKAIEEAEGVLFVCPPNPLSEDPLADADRIIKAMRGALERARPHRSMAISDYGADCAIDTGITLAFRELEQELGSIGISLILLRSAEHMQNLARVVPIALTTGFFSSFHHPLTKLYPTASAYDVGDLAAELLIDETSFSDQSTRVIHVEGPVRYSANDVATVLSDLSRQKIEAIELPREKWLDVLCRGGMNRGYAELIARTFDAHNAGFIEAEKGGEIRQGNTTLSQALSAMLLNDQNLSKP